MRKLMEINQIREEVTRYFETIVKWKVKILERIDVLESKNTVLLSIRFLLFQSTNVMKTKIEQLLPKKKELLAQKRPKREILPDIIQIETAIKQIEDEYDKKIMEYNDEKDLALEVIENTKPKINELLANLEEDYEYFCEAVKKLADTTTDCLEYEKVIYTYENVVTEFHEFICDLKEMQSLNWIYTDAELKVAEILENHGMVSTHSGSILTRDGRKLTFEQAKDEKLFDKIPICTKCLLPYMRTASNYNILRNLGYFPSKVLSDSSSWSQIMPDDDDFFLTSELGKPLTLALNELTRLQPISPIYYLVHWLIKYRYNLDLPLSKKKEIDNLHYDIYVATKKQWDKFVLKEVRAVIEEIMSKVLSVIDAMNAVQVLPTKQEEEEEEDIWGQAKRSERCFYRKILFGEKIYDPIIILSTTVINITGAYKCQCL